MTSILLLCKLTCYLFSDLVSESIYNKMYDKEDGDFNLECLEVYKFLQGVHFP